VPEHADAHGENEIPVTYVPARNTIMLSIALGWAEVLGANDIFVGVNAVDYSGYPDCRPEFIRAFEALANLATKAGVEGAARFTLRREFGEVAPQCFWVARAMVGADEGEGGGVGSDTVCEFNEFLEGLTWTVGCEGGGGCRVAGVAAAST